MTIVRFDLQALRGLTVPFPVATLAALPGSLNNQWSMDEHNGYLRVTTTGRCETIKMTLVCATNTPQQAS